MSNVICHAELHGHTSYSALDGYSKVNELAETCAAYGLPAVAITDHGNTHGALAFQRACDDNGIKAIHGIEAYTALDASHKGLIDAVVGENGRPAAYFHQTLWCENGVGLRNMRKLHARSWKEGFYRKPRFDLGMLADHHEGLIVSTGCPSGAVSQMLRMDAKDAAYQYASDLVDIMGPDKVFVELMNHGLGEKIEPITQLIRLAQDLKLPVIATNDFHYVDEDDKDVHSCVLAAATNARLKDPKRWTFGGSGYYVHSAEEMSYKWGALPQALENTRRIAERCNAHLLELPGMFMPHRDDAVQVLHDRISEALGVRKAPMDKIERAWYEFDIITNKQYATYFLMVSEIQAEARRRDIMVAPSRGSGGGSYVAYLLGITGFDPTEHECYFERFLNPERDSPPDFDLDFQADRRGEMIDWAIGHYGEEHVAAISTMGVMGAKGSLKKAAFLLDQPVETGVKLTEAMPPDQAGFFPPLSVVFDEKHKQHAQAVEMRALLDDPTMKEVYDLACDLEGTIFSIGTHAGGIIIADVELTDVVGVMQNKDGRPQIECDGGEAEQMGLVKFDFLGTKVLAVLSRCIDHVKTVYGEDPREREAWDSFADPKAFEVLQTPGGTAGIFQFTGAGITGLLHDVKPKTLGELADVSSLYRPGPKDFGSHTLYARRKAAGKHDYDCLHAEVTDDLSEIVKDTWGVLVYQEQVMAVAQKLAGYTLGEADVLRRAMGKKKPEVMRVVGQEFRAGMKKNGYSDEAIDAVWETLPSFAKYGFNRCVTGDTELTTITKNTRGRLTVKEIYDRLYGRSTAATYHRDRCYRQKFRDPKRGLWTWGVGQDGRTVKRRVVDIHHNGMAPTFKITTASGATLTSTANHRHWSDGRWVTTENLRVGDNMSKPYYSTKANKTYDYCHTGPNESRDYKGAKLPNHLRNGENSLGYVNGESIKLREWTESTPKVCSKVGCDASADRGDRIERAHLDGNRRNNDASNLAMLCVSCHKKHDYRNNGRVKLGERGLIIESDPIVSIEYAGVQEVFDVEVESDTEEGHSWLANGLLTHNSHAVGYSIISYWLAYLKAVWPDAFWSATLDWEDDKANFARFSAAAKQAGVTIKPPHVNYSQSGYAPDGQGDIVMGLDHIARMPTKVAEQIVANRGDRPYSSVTELILRCPAVTPSALVLLARVHALPGITSDEDRASAIESFGSKEGDKWVKKVRKAGWIVPGATQGATWCDAKLPAWEPPIVFDEVEPRFAAEMTLLGRYVSDNPFGELLADEAHGLRTVETEDGKYEGLAAVNVIEHKVSKKGSNYLRLGLVDLEATAEVIPFGKLHDVAARLDINDVVKYEIVVKDGRSTLKQLRKVR